MHRAAGGVYTTSKDARWPTNKNCSLYVRINNVSVCALYTERNKKVEKKTRKKGVPGERPMNLTATSQERYSRQHVRVPPKVCIIKS